MNKNKIRLPFFLKKYSKYPLSLAAIFSSALYAVDTTPTGVTVKTLGDSSCTISGNACYYVSYDEQKEVIGSGANKGYRGTLTYNNYGLGPILKYTFYGDEAFIEKLILNGTGADSATNKVITLNGSFAGSGIKQATIKNALLQGDYINAGGPPATVATNLTFTGGKDGTLDQTRLIGSVKNYNGKTVLSFTDANMSGDLIAGVSGSNHGENTATFQSASLTGDITSNAYLSGQNALISSTASVKQTVTFDGVAPSLYTGNSDHAFSLGGNIVTNFGTVDVKFTNSAVMIGNVRMTKNATGASGAGTLTSSTTLSFDHSILIGNIVQDGADKGTFSFDGNNALDSAAMKGIADNRKGEMDITLKGGAKWIGSSTTNLAISNSGTTTIALTSSSIEGDINNNDGTLTLTLDHSTRSGGATLIGGDVNITATNNSKIGSFDGPGGKLTISLDSSSSAGDIKNNDENSSVEFTHTTASTTAPSQSSNLSIGDVDFSGKLNGTLEFYKIGSIYNSHNASSDLTLTTSSIGDISDLDKLTLTNTSTGNISSNSTSATLNITQKDQSMGNINFAGTLKATLDSTGAKDITITNGTANLTLSNKSSTGSIKSLGGTTTLMLDGSDVYGGLSSSSEMSAKLSNESLIHGDLLSSGGTSNVTFENGASVLGSMTETAGEMNTVFSSDSTKIAFKDFSTLFPSMDTTTSPLDFSTLSDDQKKDLASSVTITDVIKYLNASKISNYDGTISTSGGTHKVDFQDSLYLGGFVNTTSGIANITLSFSDDFISKLKGNALTNFMLYDGNGPDFYINTSGDGVNNIALSGSIKGTAHFTYSGGHTNIVFSDTIVKSAPIATTATTATSSSIIGDTTDFNDKSVFDPSSSDTSKKVVKVNGHTFQDGLLIQLDSDKANSILSSYRGLYADNQATFHIDKITDANVYTAKIKGVIVGDVYSLANSTSVATKNYEAVLEENAVFIGNLNISDRNVSVELSKGSKLILSDGSTIAKLSNNEENAPDSIDFGGLIGDTLTQGNAIIDLATRGIPATDSAIKPSYATLNISEVDNLSSTIFRVSYNPQASADTQESDKSDHIIISKVSNTGTGELQNYLQAYQNASDFVIGDLSARNILVLSVANDSASGKSNMNFNDTSSVQQGYDVITTVFETRQEDSSNPTPPSTATAPTPPDTSSKEAVSSAPTDSIKPTDTSSSSTVESSSDSTPVASAVMIGAADATPPPLDSTASSGSADSSAPIDKKAWTNYYVKSADAYIMQGYKDNTQAAISTNYDIFLSNINDLNKRLGELRGNPNEQGVWGRIFNGMNTSNRGEEVSIYSTDVQGGYDFSIPNDGARSYFGAALSYGYNVINGTTFTGKAQSIEVGAYYSFVSDEGFYTDTILKYAFILNQLSLPKNQSSANNLNSSTISLGEEFGYRWNFLLKEKQTSRHSLYLEPQAEFILGYIGNGTFNQVNGNSYLDSNINSILAFRGRIGGVMGYAFRTARNQTDFRLGLSYVGDIAGGGDIGMKTNFSEMNTTTASNQMGMVSLGVNSILSDQWRVYADLDTSFGGQYFNQTYLISIGGRYAFGKQNKNVPSAKARQIKNPSNQAQDTQARIPSGYYWIVYGVPNDSKLSTQQEDLIKKYPYVVAYEYQTTKDKSGKLNKVLFKYYLLGGFKSKDGAIKNQKVANEVAQILNNKQNIEAILKEVK